MSSSRIIKSFNILANTMIITFKILIADTCFRINTFFLKSRMERFDTTIIVRVALGTVRVVREALAELNLEIIPKKLKFVTLIQNVRYNYIYTYFFYEVPLSDEIKYHINEPNQIKDLPWTKMNNLPKNILPHNKVVIESYFHNIYYRKI